ncbi:MAG: S8 family serine peptidase, partial [Natronosporangium sp.]
MAASLLSAPAGPASAAAPPVVAGIPAGFLPSDVEPVAVTLITGDTVYWQDSGDGNPRVAEIEEAPRDYPVTFNQSGTQEDFYVIPTDVMEHVVAGTVDMELFNIPGLIRQGLDDASTDELPVIVTFDHDQSVPQLARAADALPATDSATAVEGINGAGVQLDRAKASSFRQAVFGVPGGDANRTAGAPGLDGGVDKVMLDQMLEIDLSESVPQIGAPQAWDAGFTGEGVTVAVLDTGVDASHPDLAGQVVATANFTDEPDATDNHGHGTHVASTIAGTGAASDGARVGVAPGADLLIGKVCTTDGECQTSAIMAGMEWAAEHGADVVNMSLGGGATDGTDPLSLLVNQLSAETGTLFVTSAGNTRIGIRVVGSPATADAALAVGAVDKSDQRARFSSRGPRVGDHAVKPEITAPGVGIVAARAEGTGIGEPADGSYTSLDGTSMAAPHVAGAAALLAQATGLAGGELKDALVSSAADGGYRWYEQGTGRVRVPAAVDSPVYAQGTLNFGGIEGRAERDLVYTNRSQNDVVLTLKAAVTDLFGRPASGVSLSADSLTVPAHGTASVTVTVALDASSLTGQESFGGAVTATGPENVALRTGVGFGPPLRRVTMEVLDSDGERVGSDTARDTWLDLTQDTLDRMAGGSEVYTFSTDHGVAIGHVPTGKYTFVSHVAENEPGASLEITRTSMLVKVEVDISSDTHIVLDAREAVPIQVGVPREADKRSHATAVIRELAGGGGRSFTLAAVDGGGSLYATPAPPGQLAPVGLFVTWTLAEPQPLLPLAGATAEQCARTADNCYSEAPAYVYNLPILYENGIPQTLHKRIARGDLVEVRTYFHSDHPDALILQQFESLLTVPGPGSGNAVRVWFQPGEVVEYFLADDRITWNRAIHIERQPGSGPSQTVNLFSTDRFPATEAGSRRGGEHWNQAPMRMAMVDIREEALNNLRPIERWAAASRSGGQSGAWFTVPFQLTGNSRGHFADVDTASWRMWNADTGTELVRTGLTFPLASGRATYRLQQVDDLASYPYSTGPATTTWTFTSRPSETQVPEGYRCPISQEPRQNTCQIQPLIRLEYDLGLDIGNRARAGRTNLFTITAGHHSKAIDRAPIISLRVQASFDDGDTWHHARVLGNPRESFDTGGLLPSAEPYQQYRV